MRRIADKTSTSGATRPSKAPKSATMARHIFSSCSFVLSTMSLWSFAATSRRWTAAQFTSVLAFLACGGCGARARASGECSPEAGGRSFSSAGIVGTPATVRATLPNATPWRKPCHVLVSSPCPGTSSSDTLLVQSCSSVSSAQNAGKLAMVSCATPSRSHPRIAGAADRCSPSGGVRRATLRIQSSSSVVPASRRRIAGKLERVGASTLPSALVSHCPVLTLRMLRWPGFSPHVGAPSSSSSLAAERYAIARAVPGGVWRAW
mmetsp:Transcript_21775/g.61612  ORF Transcript_21775/g.61612 Transcript_21775/m.61612 type:complete len:263 (-) Transcript_21775:31-819(-)